ncbi:MAG: cell division protein FtsL [Gammaproteobacteria bacterium]|nr:cell division protein FtsL [Gammaproteobacteria bacterium]MDH5630001.1 cell division protein FtsL [Gammaproteobacteria bacterium]
MKDKNAADMIDTAPTLIKAVLSDLFVRHWFISFLALLFIVSALMLAQSAHQTRRLTNEWQNLTQQQQSYQIRWESLRLELTSLSETDRISSLARKQLGMVKVTSKNEKVITQ